MMPFSPSDQLCCFWQKANVKCAKTNGGEEESLMARAGMYRVSENVSTIEI